MAYVSPLSDSGAAASEIGPVSDLATGRGKAAPAGYDMGDLDLDNGESLAELLTQLAIIREQRGLTLDKVAKSMGIDKSAVSRLERGTTNPTVKTLRRYATAVGAYLVPMAVPAEDLPGWRSLTQSVSDALDETGRCTAPEIVS